MKYHIIQPDQANLESDVQIVYSGINSIIPEEASEEEFKGVLDGEISDFLNEIKKQQKPGKIQILGEEFVRNNLNKGKLIINNRKSCLKSHEDIQSFKDDKLKIKMIIYENTYDNSFMFKNCASLKQLSLYYLDNVL